MQLTSISVGIFILVISHSFLHACSCEPLDLKKICNAEHDAAIIKGTVTHAINHGDEYRSVFVKVEKVLKGGELLSDTIELIGGYNQNLCQSSFGSLGHHKEFYLGFVDASYYIIDTTIIPKTSNTYKRFALPHCSWLAFEFDEKKVSGVISRSDFIYSYPVEKFEERIMECNFNHEDIIHYFCPELEIFRNPWTWDVLYFGNDVTLSLVVDEVNIYTLKGERIFSSNYAFTSERFRYSDWRIPDPVESILIVEIFCGDNRIVKKLAIGF